MSESPPAPPERTSTAPPEVSVSILSWNTRDLLRRCLLALYQPDAPDVLAAWEAAGRPLTAGDVETAAFEVIVVDQESLDGSADMVAEEFPQVKLIVQKPNLGFAGGNNLAMEHARGQYFFLLNSDTVVRPGMLAALAQFAREHPQAGLIGPKLWNPDGSLQYSCRRFPALAAGVFRHTPLGALFPGNRFEGDYLMRNWDHADPRQVDWLSGAGLMATREMVDEVGPLDDAFFMYFEDVDWSRRAHDAGWEVWYAPEAEVLHEIGRSSDKAPKRMIVRHHISSYYYFRKHHTALRRPIGSSLLAAGLAVRCGLTLARNQWLRTSGWLRGRLRGRAGR